jgi:hypothetical protein
MSTLENAERSTSSSSFWDAGHLPTLIGSFFYFDTSFMSLPRPVGRIGFAILAGLAVVALIALATAQRRWIGIWLTEGGLAR